MFTKRPVPPSPVQSAPSKTPQPLFEKSVDTPTGPQARLEAVEKPNIAVPPNSVEKDSTMNQKPMGAPAPSFRPDLVKRPDLPGMASSRKPDMAPIQGTGANGEIRKLTVGRDIALAGEISACDYLVVEGTVEARLREGHRMEITETGLFRGTVEIDEADIAGRFEGEILVRGRLRVGATGRIEGKIQYGELEVEAGGQLEGQIQGLKSTKTSGTAAAQGPVLKTRTLEVAEAGEPGVAKV